MKPRTLTLSLLAALLLGAPAMPALATGRDDDQDVAREAVEDDGVLPLHRILERIRGVITGTIVDVSLERQGNRYEYRFKFIDARGQVREARFDAYTAFQLR